MKVAARLLVAALAAASLAACSGDKELQGDVLLTADRVFDGEAFHEPGQVLVRGDEIVAVGGSLDAEAERTIDLGDATILPGFIDLHVHHHDGMLEGGVTTVRNVGAPLGNLRPAGRYGGLRILMAGPLVSVPGGYPETVSAWGSSTALNVSSPGEARQAVRQLKEGGAAVIKIALESGLADWPLLTVAQVRAIVAEAHELGLRVTAHAEGAEGIRRALAGAVDELVHTPCAATDEQLRKLVEREVEVVATLHVLHGGCMDAASRFQALGGRLLYGSDFGVPGTPAGIDVEELRLLRDAGLTPAEALAAGTSEAGADLGLAPLGTLVEGAPADVIAVRGDARELRDDLASPLVVMSAGRLVAAPG